MPQDLQPLLEDNSPIKDLFPDACKDCIEYKRKIKNLMIDYNKSNEEDKKDMSLLLSNINKNYNLHLKTKHPPVKLPIYRIYNAINKFY